MKPHNNIVTAALVLMGMTLLPAWNAAAQRIPQAVDLDAAGFEPIAYRRGVSVYKHKQSEIIKLGADSRIQAPVREVFRAVMDYEGQVGKIARLSESRVLKRGQNWLLVYQRLNLPVISDRDFILRVRWGTDKGVTWIDYRAVPGPGPKPRKGIVRVSHHQGSWQLKRAPGNTTQVRFQVSIDMGGWLPKWLARSSSGKEIPEVFASLKQMIFRPEYRSSVCLSKCL